MTVGYGYGLIQFVAGIYVVVLCRVCTCLQFCSIVVVTGVRHCEQGSVLSDETCMLAS